MQQERLRIAKTLDAVNQRFYQHHGDGFDRTRQAAWPGWSQLFPEAHGLPCTSVLDIGCGNGRFASFLGEKEHLSTQIKSYVGYERDAGLLAAAQRKTLPFPTNWKAWDWMTMNSVADLPKSELVVAFGVFHHIFGHERRLQFLVNLSNALLPKGHLVLSVWDFGKDEKYQLKQLDKVAVCQRLKINPEDLDANDYFLGFGHAQPYPRYCHWSSSDEMRRTNTALIQAVPGLRRVPFQNASRDLNQYWIWSRS